MDSARFHDLLDRYHDATATTEEQAELESMMAADAECRRLFVERNLMEVQLGKSFASAMAGKPRRTLRRRSPGAPDSTWTVAAIAAAALFGAVVLFASMSSTSRERKQETVRTVPDPAPETPPAPREPEPRPILRELEEIRRVEPEPVRPVEVKPEPTREEPPKPKEEPPPPPPPPTKTETVTAVAAIVGGGDVLAGQTVKGAAILKFPDGTQMSVEGEIVVHAAKRVAVERGTVRAQVTKQPPGQPLMFVTGESELKVVGTTLRIVVTPGATRLEVTEGKVVMKRLRDGRTVDVPSGFYAVSAAGVELAARQLPINDIQLKASQGRISGDEWRVKDDALEAASTANFAAMTMPIDPVKIAAWFAKGRSRSWVTFTFTADAETDYFVWVRGRCIAPGDPGPLRLRADDVILEVADAAFVRRPADWKPLTDYLCPFNGYGAQPGFWWSGGSHDPTNSQTPITLRFKRSGRQVIRMHAMETPLQIDAIWLSTTRSTRPGPEEGPGRR